MFGINNAGHAVYTSEVGEERHAFTNWLPPSIVPVGGSCHDLHELSELDEGGESAAHDINDSDIAVGWATFDGEKHAVVWFIKDYNQFATPKIPFLDLGLLSPNSTYSEAFAINDDAPCPVIVGEGDVRDGCSCNGGNILVKRGFWRTLTDPLQDLTTAIILVDSVTPCNIKETSASDVNSDPVGGTYETTAVGTGEYSTAQCLGSIDHPGMYWNIVDPKGDQCDPESNGGGLLLANGSFSSWQARGISDIGGIVGDVFNPGPDSAAYWPDVLAPPVDIGSILGGDGASYAQRINNRNPATEVIAAAGWRTTPDQAVLWECTGTCTDPMTDWDAAILDNELIPDCSGWLIRRAFDVNDDVSIICWATKIGQPDTEHAVILEPLVNCCPEDLDRDGDVDLADLNILLAAYGNCSDCSPCIADLNCDGVVDDLDRNILIQQLLGGSPCGGGP